MLNKSSEKDFENFSRILDENNLVRIPINDKGKTLLKAISIAIYFTPMYELEVRETCLNKLKFLIENNQLPLRLNVFSNNMKLYEDLQLNSTFHGFDKIFLELASLAFQYRIIIYSVSEENRLNSQIFNYKFEKTIELFRYNTHYDVIYNNKQYETIDFCKSIIFNLIEDKFQSKNSEINLNINARKESESMMLDMGNFKVIDDEKNYNVQDPIIKPKHKKSFSSDNFNFNNNSINTDDHNRYYNVFGNLKAPKDFHHNIYSGEKKNFNFIPNTENNFKWQMEKNYSSVEKLNYNPIGKQDINMSNLVDKTQHLFSKYKEEDPSKQFENSFTMVNNYEKFMTQENMMFGNNPIPEFGNKVPFIDNESEIKKTGRLKFFDENKNYGFIIMDEDGSDIFVHYDDLLKSGVTKEFLRAAKQGIVIRFSFNCMNYIGKYNKSKKAINLILLNPFI